MYIPELKLKTIYKSTINTVIDLELDYDTTYQCRLFLFENKDTLHKKVRIILV